MTNFMYYNNEQLSKLSSFYWFNGTYKMPQDKKCVKVYKYILAYLIVIGKNIRSFSIERIKKEILALELNTENLVFFEKLMEKKDLLYFSNFMKEAEKDPEFYKTWEKWFAEVS